MNSFPTSVPARAVRSCSAKLALLVLVQAINTHAEIAGPYSPDAHTLHLWHLDSAGPPLGDAVVGGLELAALENGATLGNESYVGPKKFGTALGTYTGNPSQPPGSAGQAAALSALPLENGRGDNVPLRYAGIQGAFTYEALVRIDFDPAANFGTDGWGQGRSLFMQLLSGDADENAERVFQFRIAPNGTLSGNRLPLLEFINLNQGNSIQSLTAPIPTDGSDAIRMGGWYHVAVTYSGQPDRAENLRFYWTSLEPGRVAARQIGSGQMKHSLPGGCSPDFALGQTGRQSPVTTKPNNNFVGLIDEVRISGVARSPQEMVFRAATVAAKPAPVETKPAKSPEPGPATVAAKPEKPADPVKPADAVKSADPLTPAGTQKASLHPTATFASGAVVRGPTDKPRVAIMFSCRTPDEVAADILKALQAASAKASFFVSDAFLSTTAGRTLAQSMLTQGHYLGPQADSWSQLTSRPANLAPDKLPPDVAALLDELAGLGADRKRLRYFLPTSDQLTVPVAERARALGLTMVAGTPGTLSFAVATVEGTKEFASTQAINKSILKVADAKPGLNGYLLLFPLDAGSRRADKYYPRFSELLGALQKRGCEFVRVDELLEAPAPAQAQPPLAETKQP